MILVLLGMYYLIVAHAITPYKDGESEELLYYIGKDPNENSDGKTLKCELYQKTSFHFKFGNVTYVANYRMLCVKRFLHQQAITASIYRCDFQLMILIWKNGILLHSVQEWMLGCF